VRITRKEAQLQTRDRLRAAANASIIEEGVAGISIRGICGAAGHSQGAFYSNFSSKDDLLVEIMQAHIEDEVTLLRDLVHHADGADIETTLKLLAGRLAQLAAEPQWSLLSIELQLHARRNAAFAERHRKGKAACYRMFGELVSDLTRRFGLTPPCRRWRQASASTRCGWDLPSRAMSKAPFRAMRCWSASSA
jgi:AcrR family transcriptional regulator